MTVIKQYNENTDQWELVAVGSLGPIGPSGPTGPMGPRQYIGITGPTGATEGDQWFSSDLGRQFVFYDNAWIEVGNAFKGDPGITASATPPFDTSVLWLDIDEESYSLEVGPTGPTGYGVPSGGQAGSILIKSSLLDYDSSWQPRSYVASDVAFSRNIWPAHGVNSPPRWFTNSSGSNVFTPRTSYATGTPLPVIYGVPIDLLYVSVTTAQAGTSASWGVYGSDFRGRPLGGLLASGTFDVSATGVKSLAVSITPNFPMMWLFILGSGTPTWAAYGYNNNSAPIMMQSMPGFITENQVVTTLNTVGGAIPSAADGYYITNDWGSQIAWTYRYA